MKKVNIVVSSFVILLMALGCSKQSDTYYPNKEGMLWVYQKSYSGMFGMSESSKLTVTNLKERELNNKKVLPKKYESGGKTNFIFVAEEKDGLVVYANQPTNAVEPVILNPPRYFLKFPLKIGTEWEDKSNTFLLQKNIPITMKYSIVSIDETVTVPSGSYNKCVKVKGVGNTVIDEGMFGKIPVEKEVYDWFAPNIGWIKGIINENTNNMLVGKGMVSYQLEDFKNK